jgi:DNA anti-recombination protein RmuC
MPNNRSTNGNDQPSTTDLLNRISELESANKSLSDELHQSREQVAQLQAYKEQISVFMAQREAELKEAIEAEVDAEITLAEYRANFEQIAGLIRMFLVDFEVGKHLQSLQGKEIGLLGFIGLAKDMYAKLSHSKDTIANFGKQLMAAKGSIERIIIIDGGNLNKDKNPDLIALGQQAEQLLQLNPNNEHGEANSQ